MICEEDTKVACVNVIPNLHIISSLSSVGNPEPVKVTVLKPPEVKPDVGDMDDTSTGVV